MPRPLFVSALLCAGSLTAYGQDPVRPWLDWRTVTAHGYRFHYPAELERWALDLAARARAVDSAVTAQVGRGVPKPMDVVLDDPLFLPNGYALPFLDKPVSVWYAMPADPRNDIGNYRTWGEMLAVHELAHIAHMARPSRNPFQRALWSSLPVSLGPIALRAPRWVYEGYATVVEGRVTGTGRPNNAWRPALLRQWAVEGRLPTYGQLAAWDDFSGGDFAYLGGSAFLEWLTAREGDASLSHLWRRLTARRVRTFDAAFRGVFGDAPAALYGLHTAQLTRDAMAARETLERAGLVEGEMLQRLSWYTGDPAISPDGARVAISLRERDRPGRLVVWKTTAEAEDTALIRRRIAELTRDPEDVPDRRFYPVPKRAVTTLPAAQGRSYQMPRWFADNRRVLATRWTTRGDNTLSAALYVWDTETGDVRRVTNAVGVLHGDPHPNARDALAMQCHWGHCDIVHVNLERGVMRTLLEGAPDRSYYRPRWSPDGTRFVASVLDQGSWKLLVSNASARDIRFVDPGDGANRYDAQWLTADTLVAVSERGGIPNLEKLAVADARPVAVTRVVGAALAPEVNRADSSLWFLSLHSRGLDVRRLPARAAPADSAVAITAAAYGFAGMRGAEPVELPAVAVDPPRPYGAGPRHQRWVPGAYYSGDGPGATVTVFTGDIVGRLNASVTGAYGVPGAWQGGSLRATWRYPRPHVEFGAHGFIHEPSLGRNPQPRADSVDATLVQSLLATTREHAGDAWRLRWRAGAAAGRLSPREITSHTRTVGFAEGALRVQQYRGSRGVAEEVRVHAGYGRTRAAHHRVVGTLDVRTFGRDMPPFQASLTAGRLVGSPHPFELFTIGGAASPVMDSSLLVQRHAMGVFPTAVSAGKSLLAWRVAIPGAWTLYYEAASTAPTLYAHGRWFRAAGFDARALMPLMPVAFVPRIEIRGGAAWVFDEPFRNRVRGFLEMKVEP